MLQSGMTIDYSPVLEDISRPGSTSKRFVVKVNNVEVGLIEKFNPTPGDVHPWKASVGIGFKNKFLSAHYGRNGKREAIDAVLVAANL